MWCVAELDDQYIAKMEEVLETYEKPYDPAEPVVCLDEKPVTLHADVRPTSPAEPGREARRDNEYERRGTANVFCAVEPKAGRHFTFATPNRSAFEFARVACELALQYPEAKTIHLVLDNLNIHRRKSIDGCLRNGHGRRGLGPLHDSLHSSPRELAQSGRNRNRPLLAPVPRKS
jgi:DDE superfamily endonuclease